MAADVEKQDFAQIIYNRHEINTRVATPSRRHLCGWCYSFFARKLRRAILQFYSAT